VIILDTNIASVFLHPQDRWDPAVMSWVESMPRGELHITTITRAEIAAGVAVLPDGRRKREYADRMKKLFAHLEPVTLPFDVACADYYGAVIAARKAAGRPIAQLDAQIAAIALRHHAAVATRDTSGFESLGLPIVNPYEAP
jgi:predicted nucleic acid-binding protein